MSEEYILIDASTNKEYLLKLDNDIDGDINNSVNFNNIDKNTIIKAEKLTPDEYEKIKKELEPLPDKYYVDRRDGEGFAQFHIRGITVEDYEAYQSGKKSFENIIIGHSLHMDLRYKLEGLDKLVQYVVTESDIDSYLRMMKGEKNPNQRGAANVQKALVVAKPSGEPPENLKKAEEEEKEVLLNKESAKTIKKYIISDQSYFINPGEVGSYEGTYAYLALIWRGKVREGVQRPDLHEIFLFPDSDIPNINKELFNGRFIVRCFRQNNDKIWLIFKATEDQYPMNSWCSIDKSFHFLTDPKNVKYIGHEEYPEWKERKEICQKKK